CSAPGRGRRLPSVGVLRVLRGGAVRTGRQGGISPTWIVAMARVRHYVGRRLARLSAMATRPRPTRPPDRAATEAALEQAALRLLERNGVLAGLNLREVADEAGVNRGLVYHYFGSRRDLLRAALGADVRERIRDLEL